jgi:hypothetical protein
MKDEIPDLPEHPPGPSTVELGNMSKTIRRSRWQMH